MELGLRVPSRVLQRARVVGDSTLRLRLGVGFPLGKGGRREGERGAAVEGADPACPGSALCRSLSRAAGRGPGLRFLAPPFLTRL